MDSFLTERVTLIKNPKDQVGVEFNVLGTWWENMTPTESKKIFPCVVVAFHEVYQWARGVSNPGGAYMIKVLDTNEDLYPMSELDFARQMQLDSSRMAQNVTPVSIQETNVSEMETEDTAETNNKRSLVYQYCTPVTAAQEASHPGCTHRCNICRSFITKVGTSTSGLVSHFANKHQLVHAKILAHSAHSKRRTSRISGRAYNASAFKEALPHHVHFALWLIKSKRPFSLGDDSSFRLFCESLNQRYTPPHRDTVHQILNVVNDLLRINIKKQLDDMRTEIGMPFCSA